MSLGTEARDAIRLLRTYGDFPPVRTFWLLTPEGIVLRELPIGARSPRELGLVRSPQVRIHDPVTGEELPRVRLWVPESATEDDIARWMLPYRPIRAQPLVEVRPVGYDLRVRQPVYAESRAPRIFTVSYQVDPVVRERLGEIVEYMNGLPYQGVWRLWPLVGGGYGIAMMRGFRPTIVFDPRTQKFYALQREREDFDPEQFEETAYMMVLMLGRNFPQYFAVSRHSYTLPPDLARRLQERALRRYEEREGA